MLSIARDSQAHISTVDARFSNDYSILDCLSVLEITDEFPKCFSRFVRSLRIYEQISPGAAGLYRGRAFHCAGIYFLATGRANLAECSYRIALKIKEEFGEPIDIFKANNGIAQCMLERGDLNDAHAVVVALGHYCEKINDDEVWVEYYQTIATLELELGNLRPCLQALRRVLHYLRKRGDLDEIMAALVLVAMLLRAGRNRWARKVAQRYLEISRASGMQITPRKFQTVLDYLDGSVISISHEQHMDAFLRRAGITSCGQK